AHRLAVAARQCAGDPVDRIVITPRERSDLRPGNAFALRKESEMANGWGLAGIKGMLRQQMRVLLTITPSDRLWQMPIAAALASGLPLFVGAYFGYLQYGLVSSLGGLVFLYLPNTPMSHRMVMLMACAFAMIICYAL